MTIAISISGNAPSALSAFSSELATDGAKHAAGRGVRRLLMDYLSGLDSSRANQSGGKRTHFYAGAARNVSYDVDDDGATVSVHEVGIAQRYYGGTIVPTAGHKFLTIPVDPDAYGRRAGEFDNLSVQYGLTKGGKARPMFLVQDNGYRYTQKKNRKTGVKEVTGATWEAGKIMFYLALSVHQDADPSVLPSEDLMNQAAMDSITRYLLAIAGRAPHE